MPSFHRGGAHRLLTPLRVRRALTVISSLMMIGILLSVSKEVSANDKFRERRDNIHIVTNDRTRRRDGMHE